MKRGRPWDTCGSALRVRARDRGSDRQRWVWDGDGSDAEDSGMLRHFLDGRALDVNFWRLERGTGVNVNVPHTHKRGVSWVMQTVGGEDGAPAPDLAAVAPPFPSAVLASAPDGAEVFIKSAKSRGFCLSVRSDGYTGDKAEVYLAKHVTILQNTTSVDYCRSNALHCTAVTRVLIPTECCKFMTGWTPPARSRSGRSSTATCCATSRAASSSIRT